MIPAPTSLSPQTKQHEKMSQQEENNHRIDPLLSMRNSISMSIGLANLPEFGGGPNEDVVEFLKKFGRVTTALSQEQKCVALKKALVGDASVFLKNYLKQHLLHGEWKTVKNLLRNRFSRIEPSLLYRTELNKMSFDPTKNTLLGYVDHYANLYRKIHSEAKDDELIQDISLNLGKNIVLKLNQLSTDWKTFPNFEIFRNLITRLEKDILALEADVVGQNNLDMANTVNQLVTSALEPPIKQFQDLIQRLRQSHKEDPESEKLAAVKHGRYPDASDKQQRRETGKRRDRDWDEDEDRYKAFNKRARDLRRAYEERFGEVNGPCFYC